MNIGNVRDKEHMKFTNFLVSLPKYLDNQVGANSIDPDQTTCVCRSSNHFKTRPPAYSQERV